MEIAKTQFYPAGNLGEGGYGSVVRLYDEHGAVFAGKTFNSSGTDTEGSTLSSESGSGVTLGLETGILREMAFLAALPVGVKEIIFKQKWFMEWQDKVRNVHTELLTPHYGWRYHVFLEQVHTLRGAVNFHGYKTTINVERFVAGLQRADDPQAGQLLDEVQTKKHKPFLHEGYKDGPLFCCYRKTIVAYSNLRNGCTDLLIGRKLDLLDKYGEVLHQRASVLMETEGGFVDLGDPSSRAEHLWQL